MELNALELEHEIGRYVSKYLYIESLGDISDNNQGGGGGGCVYWGYKPLAL